MNIFSRRKKVEITPVVEPTDLDNIIIVYVLNDRFNALSPKEYLEMLLVINHHPFSMTAENLKIIEDKIGNFFIYEEQWSLLSDRNRSYWTREVINLSV